MRLSSILQQSWAPSKTRFDLTRGSINSVPPPLQDSAVLSHLSKLSEVQFPQRAYYIHKAAGHSRFALRQFCQAQHLSAAKQRSGQKLTQESKALCIACSNAHSAGSCTQRS